MKNTILILISILMLVAGTLAFISSTSDYIAEKLFYQALKAQRQIALNPDVVPPKMVTEVEKKLQKVIKRCPKANIAKVAHLGLAEFYLENKKYDQAIATADEVIAQCVENKVLVSRALFLKGNAFEKQNQWSKALQEYQILRDRHTDTLLGLGMPIYIAEYYKGKEEYDQAEQAYQDAINFYRKVERENRAKVLGYAAANLLINSHLALEQYDQAGQVLENTLNNYPQVDVFGQLAPNIEIIFVKKLNKSDKALQLYKIIRDRTTDKRALEFLDEKIKALSVQKTGQ